MKLGRLTSRGLWYVQVGAGLVGLPITLLNFVILAYYNIVVTTPFLSQMFPHFYYFAVIAIVVAVILCGLIAYIHRKRSKLFSSQMDVDVESNPYSTTKLTPNIVPFYEAWVTFLEGQGVDCTKAKVILKNSGSKKW